MPFIFLSYSHKDSEYANRLADSLEAKGLEVWIDERIDYGARWPKVIQENLDRCTAFVVVMTPNSYESEWVQAQLTRARRLRKPTFPLLLDGDVWLALEATHYVEVRGASCRRRVLRRTGQHLPAGRSKRLHQPTSGDNSTK